MDDDIDIEAAKLAAGAGLVHASDQASMTYVEAARCLVAYYDALVLGGLPRRLVAALTEALAEDYWASIFGLERRSED